MTDFLWLGLGTLYISLNLRRTPEGGTIPGGLPRRLGLIHIAEQGVLVLSRKIIDLANFSFSDVS